MISEISDAEKAILEPLYCNGDKHIVCTQSQLDSRLRDGIGVPEIGKFIDGKLIPLNMENVHVVAKEKLDDECQRLLAMGITPHLFNCPVNGSGDECDFAGVPL